MRFFVVGGVGGSGDVMHTACMLPTHGIPLQPLAFKVPMEYHTPLSCSVKHALADHFCQHLVGKPGSVTVFCGAICCVGCVRCLIQGVSKCDPLCCFIVALLLYRSVSCLVFSMENFQQSNN